MYLIEIPHQTTTSDDLFVIMFSCILSKFHIKPQHFSATSFLIISCILSKFHIKPQLCTTTMSISRVVSYRNSTSNHNLRVVACTRRALYLIEIPHQTTTNRAKDCCYTGLYLIEIPHQTTTVVPFFPLLTMLYLIEIPHQTTTCVLVHPFSLLLYLIENPHQTTTSDKA